MNTSEWRGDFNKGFRYIRNERRGQKNGVGERRGDVGRMSGVRGAETHTKMVPFPAFCKIPSILIKRQEGTVSLLCPPVAAAVKNTAGNTSQSAPNWSRAEFYYPAVSQGFHQRLLPVEQFKGRGSKRFEAAGKYIPDSMQR